MSVDCSTTIWTAVCLLCIRQLQNLADTGTENRDKDGNEKWTTAIKWGGAGKELEGKRQWQTSNIKQHVTYQS